MLSQCFACLCVLAFGADESINNRMEMQTNPRTNTDTHYTLIHSQLLHLQNVEVFGNVGDIEWHHLLFVWCLICIWNLSFHTGICQLVSIGKGKTELYNFMYRI